MRSAVALLICLALAPAVARAQGTARSMDLDPSVLSSGMGGAGTAVWWNGEPNYWANPALLGYYRGLRWQTARTHLVPDVPEDIEFKTGRFTIGGAGIGYEMAGHPIDGMGGLDVDYGNQLGSERIEASGVGVSLALLSTSILGFAGHDVPRFLRHVDVAGGYARKFTDVVIAPGASAAATSHDWGTLVRGGFGGSYTGNSDAGPLSLEAGYAHSVLNYDDVTFDFGVLGSSPPSRTRRDGVSARLAYDSYSGRNPAGSPMFSALMRGFAPIATLGFAYDWANVSAGGARPEYDTEQWGIEVTLINVLTLRGGHVRDVTGDIDDYSFGVGVALPLTEYAGARYDFASYPEAKGLSDLKRNSVSVWLNPIALHRALHSGS
ncbi:MAG: hypothetical protein ACRENS_00810 [Candidatus Eiseniibacteriota bacterium]